MNFVSLLHDHRVQCHTEGHKHCRPGWVQVDCPFCGKDSQRYHLGFNLAGLYFNCWKCGKHRTDEALAHVLRVSPAEARRLGRAIDPTRRVVVDRVLRKDVQLPGGIGKLLPKHKRYLHGRGFDWSTIEQVWKVQGIGALSLRLAWRLFIPIYHRGVVVSWTTRSVKPGTALRYLSAKEGDEVIPHKDILYGADYCSRAAVCVEGPTDAWAVGPGAVATCGIGYSRSQLRHLSKFESRFICFDNSKAAQKRAQALARELAVFPGRTAVIALDAEDPGTAKPAELRQLRRAAGI